MAKSRKRSATDALAICAGAVLASVCAWLPWHVHSNPNLFSPPRMEFLAEGTVDKTAFSLPDLVPFGERSSVKIDQLTTASTQSQSPKTPTDQPFPGDVEIGPMSLLFATPDRLLVQSGAELFVVGEGARLPDGRWVERIAISGNSLAVHLSDNSTEVWSP